jgi:hypothetical protein
MPPQLHATMAGARRVGEAGDAGSTNHITACAACASVNHHSCRCAVCYPVEEEGAGTVSGQAHLLLHQLLAVPCCTQLHVQLPDLLCGFL